MILTRMVYYFLVPKEHGGSQHDGPQKHQLSASGEETKLPRDAATSTAAWCETPGGAAVPLETPVFFTTCCKILLNIPLQECKPHKRL